MTSARPNLLAFLADDLHDLLHMADVLSEGAPCRLELSPIQTRLMERLRLSGLDETRARTSPGGTEGSADNPCRLHSLPMPEGAATDTIDLALDLRTADGLFMARLVLPGVAATALPRMRIAALETVGSLMQRHLRAMSNGSALVAAPVLAIIDAMSEGSGTVDARTLTGFLRVLAGDQGTLAEATSLRIAGLAETGHDALHSRNITLTPDGLMLLRQAGLDTLLVGTSRDPARPAPDPVTPASRTDLPPAFARLRVIEMDFDITEDRPDGPLWFRKSGSNEPWRKLDATLADGWTTVAAEILRAATDIVAQFAQMHMLRRRDLPTDEVAEAYELQGNIWWLRRDGAHLEIRRDGGAWTRTPVDPDLPQRDRSVAAVLWSDPGLRLRVKEATEAWVDRMAQAVQVHPAIAAA